VAIYFEANGRIDRRSQVGHGLADTEQLARFEPAKDAPQDLVAEGVDLLK
jgi:hypothetical protein